MNIQVLIDFLNFWDSVPYKKEYLRLPEYAEPTKEKFNFSEDIFSRIPFYEMMQREINKLKEGLNISEIGIEPFSIMNSQHIFIFTEPYINKETSKDAISQVFLVLDSRITSYKTVVLSDVEFNYFHYMIKLIGSNVFPISFNDDDITITEPYIHPMPISDYKTEGNKMIYKGTTVYRQTVNGVSYGIINRGNR